MSHPASRVLAMLELLQTHHRLGGQQLAAALGVDERTVRRYARTLADLGIPVTAQRGRYGGYTLGPGYKLPPLMLTDDEAVAVALGLVAGDQLGLATEVPATAAALAKIQRVLPAALAARLGAVRETLGLTMIRRDPAARPASAVLLALGEATRRYRRVELGYRSWRGVESHRELDPYGVVFHAGRWYVTGHDGRSGELRTFRLDRITSAVVTDRAFDPPPAGFDPVEQVTRSLASVPYTWPVRVTLETTLAEARRRIPPSTGELTEVPCGVQLTTRAEQLSGMAQMLAGLGWPFTIHEPAELRAEVARYGQYLIDRSTRPG